jgi:hypothetical protein
VKFPREDAGLVAVVGRDSDGLVSGDSPEMEPERLLFSTEGVVCALGVIALRAAAVLLERHKSLVKSMTSPAIASKAPEYRSRRNLDSVTMKSAKSSSLSSSFSACISFSMKSRCRSTDAWANASRLTGFGVRRDDSSTFEADFIDVCDTDRFATPDGVVRPVSLSAERSGGVGRALAGNAAMAC